jgi:hypothetical protein
MARTNFFYKGWAVTYIAHRPVTGTWRAERFGVGMCASTSDAIKRMIDARAREENDKTK